ncbi:import receptor [Microthyrium microscopicum]|uniref:Import receptor n=1 Tax=Microthyrium microscopicum TaxID=703497 RepID=A0A6A6UN03_9PEZI|nr:import receptor [Microthyrium microscopicum]
MANATDLPPQTLPIPYDPSASSSSLFDRISTWASENKAVVYTIAGVTVLVSAAGIYYYVNDTTPSKPSPKKKSKKRKGKKDEDASTGATTSRETPPSVSASTGDYELENVDMSEEFITSLSEQERKDYASKLKAAGNKAYGSKDFNRAIELYTKAIDLKQDPIFYSNRAACHQAMGDWEKVVDDTTAALNLDRMYVKALNRRANAYEQLKKYSEALLDYTASCIIEKFQNPTSANKVESLLQIVATEKASAMLETKKARLPSAAFISNYLQSFRPKDLPAGLTETDDIDESSGKGQLRKGLVALRGRSAADYNEASEAFTKSLELDDLGEYEALAHNMRATFLWLLGDTDSAMTHINKSIELDPTMTQSYVKRVSMYLENGDRDGALRDFEAAMEHTPDDPDIWYHRGQFHFLNQELNEAAADYQKSIDLDKDFIYSHIQLGVTQYKQGSIASSMATFRRCIKNFERVPDVYNYYGEILLDQKQFQKAVEQFDTAIDLEKQVHPTGMNVLPLVNKALSKFQWEQNMDEAQELCQKALLLDEECDIAVATMAQLLLTQGNVTEALKYFEKAADLSRTEGEIVNALQYAEATRTQIEVQQKYPQLAEHMRSMGGPMGGAVPY